MNEWTSFRPPGIILPLDLPGMSCPLYPPEMFSCFGSTWNFQSLETPGISSPWIHLKCPPFVLYCIVLYLSIFIALLTAWAFQKRSRPQQLTLCRSLHAEALQAIAGKGLAQGPYMAARAGFEPTTLWLNGVVSTNAPPCLDPPVMCSFEPTWNVLSLNLPVMSCPLIRLKCPPFLIYLEYPASGSTHNVLNLDLPESCFN